MGRLDDDALVTRLSRGAYRDFWAEPPTPARHVDALLVLYDHMLGAAGVRSRNAGLRAGPLVEA